MKRKNIILKTAVVVIVLLLLALNLHTFFSPDDSRFLNISKNEIALKSKNKLLVYEFKPNYENEKEGYFLNSFGFRDDEFSYEKETFRIALIGDSVTFGLFINDSDYIASERLEEYLNRNSSVNYEVYNFGVSGYSLFQERILLNETVMKFKPDIIIIQYLLNDIDEEFMYTVKTWFTKEEYRERMKEKSTLENQSAYCRLKYDFSQTKGYGVLKKWFSGSNDDIFASWSSTWHDIYSDDCMTTAISTNFAAIRKIAGDTPVIILNSPFLLWQNGVYYESDITETVKKMALDSNLQFIDLTESYMRYGLNDIRPENEPMDKDHPGRLGHDLAAKKTHDFLVKNRLVPDAEERVLMMVPEPKSI